MKIKMLVTVVCVLVCASPVFCANEKSGYDAADKKLLANLAWWRHTLRRDPLLENLPKSASSSVKQAPVQITVHYQYEIEEEPRAISP